MKVLFDYGERLFYTSSRCKSYRPGHQWTPNASVEVIETHFGLGNYSTGQWRIGRFNARYIGLPAH